MAILGTIFKSALEVSQKLGGDANPKQAQLAQLRNLLNKAKDTSFGKYYGFSSILTSDDIIKTYQKRIPIHEFSDIDRWWKQQQKHPDVTWQGIPDFFALSAGTTGGDSKRIPVTQDMLESIKSVSMSQLGSLANYDLTSESFEKDVLALGSSTNLSARENFREGEISGINASQAPNWFKYFYRPGPQIAAIDDWDERVDAIVKEAKSWDISVLIGIPPWVKLMLEAVIDHYKLNNIHELWPSLCLYVTGGVAFAPYRKSFEDMMGKPIHYQDTYLASEGFFAYNARPDTLAMKLAYQHAIFFEFIPFDESGFENGKLSDDAIALTIDEVEEDKDYALVISSPAGAWRYMIGDTVKFTDKSALEIVITGRTKYFMNVAGSKISEENLNQAMDWLGEDMGIKINEFSVSALPIGKGNYCHQWVIGSDKVMDEAEATKKLDDFLQKNNKSYRGARKKALKDIQVKSVKAEEFYNWIESRKKKGGQIKIPKIMKEDMMEELMKYVG